MPELSRCVAYGWGGAYGAGKPGGDISPAALSPGGRALLAKARTAFGGSMDIPAVAGFVGGWTLFHDVLPKLSGSFTSESIRAAALKVDVPTGDSINGGGVRFCAAGSLDEGQDTRAAAGHRQWAGG